LRPLDPLDLIEGQQVQVTILSEREFTRIALAHMLVKFEPEPDDALEFDEAAFLAEADAETRGKPPASDVIIKSAAKVRKFKEAISWKK